MAPSCGSSCYWNCLYFFLSLAVYSLKMFIRRATLSFLFTYQIIYLVWVMAISCDSCWSNAINLCIVTQMMPALSLGRFLRLGPTSLWPTHPFSRIFFFQVLMHTLGLSYFFHSCPWFLLVENDIRKWRPGWRRADRGWCTHVPSPVQWTGLRILKDLCTYI